MDSFNLPQSPSVQKYVFNGNSQSAGASWHTWIRPLGKSRLVMMLIGTGGGGGSGVIGANSTAGGGGGGGSGGMTIVEIPIDLLPPRLYISVGQVKTGAGVASYVSTMPNTTGNHVLAIANGGAAGGNASAGTGGTGGAGGGIATNATMCLGWPFAKLALAGQAGIAGGAAIAGGALTLPTNGLRITGGTGGGGLGAAASSGPAGGSNNGLASPSYLTSLTGGQATPTSTTPPENGKHGFAIPEAGYYYYGGTGGAATHGSATGAGLVQSSGGNGAIGSGGGGMGGALTGSTPGVLSLGGAGQVIFWCY